MRAPAVAMLFLPPRPPVRLDAGRGFVLGRSPSCDLPIPSGGASRRHAHVCWEGNGFVIRDLSSTNGTFVNGEKISGAHVLKAGDRIMIGDRTVTFCHVDSVLAAEIDYSSDTDTIAYSRPPLSAEFAGALQGSLAEIPAFAVFQVLEMGRKSGMLTVRRGGDEQRVWFVEGTPVHAVAGDLAGPDAAYEIVRPLDGQFSFQPGVVFPARTISTSVAELLLEASRRMDERAQEPAASAKA